MAEIVEQQPPVDMSAAAIGQRLRELQQLYLFSMSLRQSRFVTAARPTEQMSSPAEQSASSANRPADY